MYLSGVSKVKNSSSSSMFTKFRDSSVNNCRDYDTLITYDSHFSSNFTTRDTENCLN